MLDLSHIHLETHNVARFATKREALSLARARGWNTYDVIQAFNRFQIFWVVGERLENDVRLATKERGDVKLQYRQSRC